MYDLSMDDGATGDPPNERLAIECLPTSSANMTTKRTKSVQPFQVSFKFWVQCVFLLGPHIFRDISVGSTLLFTEAQQLFGSCSVVVSFPHRSRLRIWIVTLHCDGALVTTLLVIVRVVGDVDRREVVQVLAVGFCPTQPPTEKFCAARHSATCSRSRDGRCVPVLLYCRLLLSNDLLAIVDLRASFLFNDSLVQDNTAPSKL